MKDYTKLTPEAKEALVMKAKKCGYATETLYGNCIQSAMNGIYRAFPEFGITEDMIRDAPLLEEVTESFLAFLGTDPVAGYNVKFDLQFLWCSGIDLITDQEIYDAMLSSYGVFPKYDRRLSNHRLITVAGYYGIDFPAHNSLGDVYATAEVLVRIAEALTGEKFGMEKDLRPLHQKIGTEACSLALKEFAGLTYDEMIEALLKKYGPAEYDYFTDSSCMMKNRDISRTREGLYCHHIDEDVTPTLSDPMIARLHSHEHQTKERLVYCNLIEHLLLHIEIGRDRFFQNHSALRDPEQFEEFITHGVSEISKDLNDMYLNRCGGLAWRERCYQEIAPFYEDYIEIQKEFQRYILDHYEAPEYPVYPKKGNTVMKDGTLWTVAKCNRRSVVLRSGTEEKKVSSDCFLKTEKSAEEAIEDVRQRLSDTGYGMNTAVYRDIAVMESLL
jgi:hypothetical protein